MVLVKLPEPVPLVTLLSEVVGFWFVLQQTPRDVIVAPPSLVISPPHVAVEAVILVTAAIVMVGVTFWASFLQLNTKANIIPVRRNG